MFSVVIAEFDLAHWELTLAEPMLFPTRTEAENYANNIIHQNKEEITKIFDKDYVDENVIYEYRIDDWLNPTSSS
jgi:hypothetical protein